MAETRISRASDDVHQIAADTIDEHHEHLQVARILWLFTTAKRSSGNRVVIGTAGRTTALLRYFSSRMGHADGDRASDSAADFIVLIDQKRWQTMLQTQRLACIDSLLCRMQWRETVNERSGAVTGRWITIAPDIQEFTPVLERHGAWLPAQARMVKIVRDGVQLKFDERDLERGISGTVDDDKPVASSPDEPDRRVTTVDGEGTVLNTEHLPGDGLERTEGAPIPDGVLPPAFGDAAEVFGFASDDPALRSVLNDSEGWDGSVSKTVIGANGADVSTVDQAEEKPAGWQSQAGIGVSDIAQHRRRRGTRSSEQVPPAVGAEA